jgi:hypothetical protein
MSGQTGQGGLGGWFNPIRRTEQTNLIRRAEQIGPVRRAGRVGPDG